nr:class B sortase [uncultured Butyrivibrio sp.]
MKFKAFNSSHKKLVPFIIYFEILAILIVSIVAYLRKHYKLTALLLVVILGIVFVVRLPKGNTLSDGDEGASKASVVETIIAENPEVNEAEIAETETDSLKTNDEEKVLETESSKSVSVENAEDNNLKENSASDTANKEKTDAALYSKDNLTALISEYPETVGWIWFEDDIISYPIMQYSDNDKYSIKDYQGNDAKTGSIFLDYRSSADFSDSNTIIYGHNMRDYTMFGALKYYKYDLSFLEDHKYFQIITPEGKSRYLIFAFMDVPKNSYIYDVCGSNTERMREFLDTIEYKTYIDTGIEPTVDEKIITLSTCTKKDDLYFVMFAVKVDED